LGAVRNPYKFRLNRRIRLNELIALSGGITDNSSGMIEIFRPADANCAVDPPQSNGKERVNISVSDLLAGKEDANPVIVPGDLINVLAANPVYVIGGVTNPGQIKFRPDLTLERAVAIAGGVVKKKITGKAKIYRRSENGTQETIETDISPVGDTASEIALKPFDIIEIIERGSGERRFPRTTADGISDGDTAPIPVRTVD
jgi:protein involved in polysaccharide export with SLBB domain